VNILFKVDALSVNTFTVILENFMYIFTMLHNITPL